MIGPVADRRLNAGAVDPMTTGFMEDPRTKEAATAPPAPPGRNRGARPWGRLRLTLLASLIAGLAVLAAAGFALTRGIAVPEALTRQVEAGLALARGGRAVEIAQLHVVLADGALRLRARGVVAGDKAPAVRARPVQMDVSLSWSALLTGKARVRRADVSGGDVTVTIRRNGETEVAFGQPGARADLVFPKAETGLSLAARSRAWLSALAQALEGGAGGDRLERLRINRARLHFVDEARGAVWVAQDASLQFLQAQKRLDLSAGATLVRGPVTARFAVTVTSGTGLRDARIKFELEDALLRFLLGPKSAVQSLQAPFEATLSAELDRENGVKTLQLRANAKAGTIELGSDQLPFNGAILEGDYSLAEDLFEIRRVEIIGDALSIQAQGTVRDLAELFSGPTEEGVRFNLEMPQLALSSSWFDRPLQLRNFALVGRYLPEARSVELERLASEVASGSILTASGRVYWRDTARGLRPGLEGVAQLAGVLHPTDVLSLWPIGLAKSARDWFQTSVFEGDIGAVDAKFNVTPEDLADGKLETEALHVSFPVAAATVRVVDGMSPLRAAAGVTVIEGHSLRVDLSGARLGGLQIEHGEVRLPELSDAGFAFVKATATGEARGVIALLLETPLELQDRLPFEPDSLVGSGRLELSLSRPLRRGVTAEDVPFSAEGRFQGVGAVSKGGDIRISDWALHVQGNERGLKLDGPLRFGGSQAQLSWYERFGDASIKDRSRYRIAGRLLTPDLDLLGIPARGFAQGAVGVVAEAQGEGFEFSQAKMELDFTEAEIFFPEAVWRKPPGVRASAVLTAVRMGDGTVSFPALEVLGPELRARGQARFGPDNRLLSLQADYLKIGDRYDVTVRAGRASDGALVLSAQGALFDATPFLPKGAAASASEGPAPSGAALDIRVDADTLLLRQGTRVRDASVRIVNREGRLDGVSLQGLDPAGRPMRATLDAGVEPGLRQIDLQAQDVGFVLKGLLGESPIVGGNGSARGHWDVSSERGEIDLRIEDFRVVDLPLAARVFSSVASLQAFSDLVNGEGLAFKSLEADLVLDGDQVRLANGQAFGPAIGATASGSYNLKSHVVDANGVLVPAYGINAALGQLPGIGRVLTSRKGEGIFGFTYTVRGTADRARIAVNPLSGLAPGIFRRMFEASGEGPAAQIANKP